MSLSLTASEASAAIGKRAASGALWMLLSFGAARGLAFATNLVLARLLSPSDFGLVSYAMILIGLFTLLQDLGVPAAIIYGKRDLAVVGGTALTINVAAALVLLGVAVLGSPMMASLSGHEETASIVVALAVGLVLSAIGSVQGAVLVKELAFRRKVIPEVVPPLVSGIVSISAALLGFGVWSLVYGYLTRVTVSSILLWSLTNVRPRPEFRWSVAADLLSYGGHVSFNSMIGVIASNVDYFIIGSLLGAAQLGLYTLAFVFAGLPSLVSNEVLAKTTFPAYSRLKQDREGLIGLFSNVMTLACCFAIPAGIALYILAPAWLPRVLGQKWAGAVESLQLLTAYGVLRSIVFTFPPVFKSVGRPDVVWKLNLARLLILAPIMWWAVSFGIAGVAASQAAIYAVFVPINGYYVARTVGLPLSQFFRLIVPQAAAGFVAIALVMALNGVPEGQRLLSTLTGSLVIAILVTTLFFAIVARFNSRAVDLARAGIAEIAGHSRWVAVWPGRMSRRPV
ncbi:MAG: lipopolysaccharide biosynthesis protein [Chloroflexi bacterium]|nr:lipopolysaccharide biosynthesis protein [Chloroflexota bacterium]